MNFLLDFYFFRYICIYKIYIPRHININKNCAGTYLTHKLTTGLLTMKFKRVFPYVLSSAAMVFGLAATPRNTAINETNSATDKTTTSNEIFTENDMPPLMVHYAMESHADIDTSIISATAHKYDVVYTRANGDETRRSGGTRAWRNNNPGCLRYSEFTVAQGAIGYAGGFAVFPDAETGMRAICTLLKSDSYKNLTISQAISKYAPPHENDTASYNMNLQKLTGMHPTTKLSELSNAQIQHVARAIRRVEGWTRGTETHTRTPVPQKTLADTIMFYTGIYDNAIRRQMERTI